MAVLKIFVVLAGLFIAYFFYWGYKDRQAESAANRFCNAVVIGSAVSGIAAQAEAAGARYLSSSTSKLHKVFFQGPIFNGFYCDLTVADGKVLFRQVTRMED